MPELRLEVAETFHDFQLYLEDDSGNVLDAACMGDGVDVEYDGRTVGNEGFVEAWQRDVDVYFNEYMEAYFPDWIDYVGAMRLPADVEEIFREAEYATD